MIKLYSILTSFDLLRLSLFVFLILLVILTFYRFVCLRKKELSSYRPFDFFFLRYLFIGNILLICLFLLNFLVLFSIKPKVIYPLDPSLGVSNISNQNPVILSFDRMVNNNSLKYKIDPPLDGEWKLSQSLFKRNQNLVFSPSKSLKLNTRYTVSIDGIRNIINPVQSKYLFSFQTPDVPKIVSVIPQNGEENVLVAQPIKVKFDQYFSDKVKYDFEIEPKIELETTFNGTEYVLLPKENFKKGSSYKIIIYQTILEKNYKTLEESILEAKSEIWTGQFSVIESPGIKSFSPTGAGIKVDSQIKIEFKQDMDKASTEKAFSIFPGVSGDFSWPENRILIFKPKTVLSKNTDYKILLAKEAKILSGESLVDNLSYSFITIGYAVVSSFSPISGSKNVLPGSAVKISFNQAVNHQSAENKFKITPAVNGKFNWSGNVLEFSHDNFSYGQNYEVEISSGVVAIDGLDSKDSFITTFTAQSQSVNLAITAYKQAHTYSCMSAAARSALAYKGVIASEDQISNKIGYDTTAWSGTWNEPGSIWGDPSLGIVGDMNGKANNIGWGYGSHWNPVAIAIRSFGKTAEIKTNWTVSELAQEISNNNPVIIWWINGVWPAYEVTWHKDGKTIRAVNSMHVQVVKGFAGTVENPLTFSVTDSGYGYPGKTFDVGTFKTKWQWFGNTAIVVK